MTEATEEHDAWTHCPACGAAAETTGRNPFRCGRCGYVHYFSPNVAIGALILDEDNQMLFIVRGKDPGKGLLGLPGGFVDPGETAEDALIREIEEELNLRVVEAEYLASFPNEYNFKGIRRPVTDLFFVARVASFEEIRAQEGEVDGWKFVDPEKR